MILWRFNLDSFGLSSVLGTTALSSGPRLSAFLFCLGALLYVSLSKNGKRCGKSRGGSTSLYCQKRLLKAKTKWNNDKGPCTRLQNGTKTKECISASLSLDDIRPRNS